MKANKHESLSRQATIQVLLLEGFSRQQIIEYCSKNFSIRRAQTDNYIKKINITFEEEARKNDTAKYCEAVARTRHLYNKCIEKGDLRTASTVLRELNNIEGVQTMKLECSLNEHHLFQRPAKECTPDELMDRIKFLVKQPS